ncbi:averantin oxidoreductase [Dactylonectria estremocensis]|uniref:Averantin oxidoreductase n=1 Tax=Dactylonectria estremocensis TaxID=1079267 RepID=A0A9P9EH38_9HYPO|nr:averantin oxidoreductase [Dactylonectria estremocensis]
MDHILANVQSETGFAAAFGVGVLLHVGVFRHGEWDLHTTRLLGLVIFLNTSLAGLLFFSEDVEFDTRWKAFRAASLLSFTTLAGVYSSIIVYRAAFHRLNRFPGPFAARISNLYVTLLSIKKFQLYEEVQNLHEKYGDIVRIGPSELSISDPKAVQLLHSNSSPCTKGPWYNILHPVKSLHMIRDQKEHSQRRKTWDKGLSTKALRDYEPRVAKYTNQLLEKIEETKGLPFDASTLFNFYSFDVMGDLAFGKSFDMLKDGVVHYFMKSVHANMLAVSAFSHLVWIFPLFKEIPGLNHEHLKFQSWLSSQVVERQKNKPDLPDLFSWILADYDANEKPSKQDTVNLHGDAHLIVVAGSDTTAASLTCLFFELATHPDTCRQLQDEIDQYYATSNGPEHLSLSKLKYLQACIDESLRLHPPVPSGLQRMTPPEGFQIGETFIPGNTILQIPSHTLYRDKRVFDQPNEFVPERWTTQPEMTKDGSIFQPFSFGRYSCAGKQLGLMELRYVTSQVLRRYNVRLADGLTPGAFLAGLKDGFTLASPGLKLVLTERQRE